MLNKTDWRDGISNKLITNGTEKISLRTIKRMGWGSRHEGSIHFKLFQSQTERVRLGDLEIRTTKDAAVRSNDKVDKRLLRKNGSRVNGPYL